MYFPPPRTAYEAADTSRFYVDGTGFIDFCEEFKYLGSILHYSLTFDADVNSIQADSFGDGCFWRSGKYFQFQVPL